MVVRRRLRRYPQALPARQRDPPGCPRAHAVIRRCPLGRWGHLANRLYRTCPLDDGASTSEHPPPVVPRSGIANSAVSRGGASPANLRGRDEVDVGLISGLAEEVGSLLRRTPSGSGFVASGRSK